MNLTEREAESELWRKLTGHLNDLLSKSHVEIEKQSLTLEQTAFIRGRIKLIRQLLNIKPADKTTEKYR